MPSRKGRALAGIIDQGVSSGTNFLTVLIPGLLFGPEDAGTLVLALSLGYIALGVQRAMVGDPLLAYASAFEEDERRTLVRDATTTALGLGVLAGLIGVIAWSTGSALTADMIWLAPWLPAVLVQDAGRYAFLAARRPDRALILDVVWALAQAAAVVVVLLTGHRTHGAFAAAWGIGALAGAIAYVVISGVNPLRGRPLEWFRKAGHLSGWFTVTAVLAQTQYYLILFVVAIVLDRAATGGLRYMQLLVLQPVQVVLLAAISLLVPRAARLAATGDAGALAHSTGRLARLFGPAALLVLVAIPLRHVAVELIFPRFASFAGVLVPVACSAALYTIQTPFTTALRGMQRARALFVVQILFTVTTVPAALAGAVLGGAVGAAWGLLAGAVVQLAALLVNYRAGLIQLRAGRLATAPVD